MYGKITQHQEMGYDRSVGMFSPDGLLLQVEYASKAVTLGTPVLGMIYDNGIVIIGDRKIVNRLLIKESLKKVFEIDENIIVGASGVMSDARRLIEKSQLASQEHRIQYNQEMDLISLVKDISNIQQYYTQAGGLRPFGCSLLYGGFEKDKPTLYLATPSGIYMKFLARAIGKNSEKINELLEKNFKIMKLKDSIKYGIKLFKEVLEDEYDIERFDVVCLDKTNGIKRFKTDEIK